jgi:hypothetical protein
MDCGLETWAVTGFLAFTSPAEENFVYLSTAVGKIL